MPYWLQLVLYPMIKDTECGYCIFIRGAVFGSVLTILLGGLLWVGLSHYETPRSANVRSQLKELLKKKPPFVHYTNASLPPRVASMM